jgi:L-alanine-DL-glutamate epimerase-like enolase superfamily enzyme
MGALRAWRPGFGVPFMPELNIAPHNFYGHLATMMNAHFAAATPNLRIMEVDIDRLSWDKEVFTKAPQFEDGPGRAQRAGVGHRAQRRLNPRP